MGRLAAGLQRMSSTLSWVNAHLPKTPQLYTDRFARIHEVDPLVSPSWQQEAGLLIGVSSFNHVLSVRQTGKRQELGNVLVDALTRGGKGLLAISQLLTWPHSVVVLDIKGELYEATAAYRKTLGPVFVIDPEAVGNQFGIVSKGTSEPVDRLTLLGGLQHICLPEWHMLQIDGMVFWRQVGIESVNLISPLVRQSR